MLKSLTHSFLNSSIAVSPTSLVTSYSTDYNHSQNQLNYSRLATLSLHQRWIFVTSECGRLSQSTLVKHNVCVNKVVHIKPSSALTETEIVAKAIENKTASAIIASDHIDAFSQAYLLQLAKSNHCEVFFTSNMPTSVH